MERFSALLPEGQLKRNWFLLTKQQDCVEWGSGSCANMGASKIPGFFEKTSSNTSLKRLPQLPTFPRPFHRRRVRISHDSEYSIIYAIYALAPWAETTSSHRSKHRDGLPGGWRFGCFGLWCNSDKPRTRFACPAHKRQYPVGQGKTRAEEGFLEGITLWLERLHGYSTNNKGDFMGYNVTNQLILEGCPLIKLDSGGLI